MLLYETRGCVGDDKGETVGTVGDKGKQQETAGRFMSLSVSKNLLFPSVLSVLPYGRLLLTAADCC